MRCCLEQLYQLQISKSLKKKKSIIEESEQKVEEIQRSFRRGRLTDQERNERVIEIWQETTDRCCKSS